ncbi:MAG: hypothetical protein HY057_08045 [Rhodospirillales bacterium]|nr:hypothetical protein [Rhodospirillales bacterium]
MSKFVPNLAAFALAGAVLAGCGGMGEFPWIESPPAPTPASRPPENPAPPSRPAETRKAPRPPAAAPEITLVGLTQVEMAELLGRPADEREAAPAKVWQYRSRECALDVYFYLDVSRNDFYALHYELQGRKSAATAAATDRCLRSIYNGRNRP